MVKIFILFCSLLALVRNWCEHSRFYDTAQQPVTSVDYSPDGTMIVTTTKHSVTIWERKTKNIIFIKNTVDSVYAKFSRDSPSTYIGISKKSSLIQIISATSPFGSIVSFDAQHGGTDAPVIDFNPSLNVITCGSTNNKIKMWNIVVTPPSSTNIYDASLTQSTTCAYYSGNNIGVTRSSGTVQIGTMTAPTTYSPTFTKSLASCTSLSFSPDNTIMIVGCNNIGAHIVISTGTVTNIVTSGNIGTVAYSGDGRTISYGSEGGAQNTLHIVDANKTILSQFIYTASILSSDFSTDGLHLIIGADDGTIYQYAKYCLSCRPGYYVNLTTKTCGLCDSTMKGCSYCVNSSYCLQCYQNFIYDAVSHTCQSCSSNINGCGTCFNLTACRFCLSGYYLQPSNYTCIRCQIPLKGCYICNSSSYCSLCQSDFYLNTVSNTCIGCQQAVQNCIKCVNSSYCTSCKIGYFPNSGSCTSCPINCYACQSSTNCTDCVTGYYALSSGGSVTCTKCPTGCLACNATGYCTSCADERYLNAGSCTQCSYPCTTCNSSSYCLSCDSAYFYSSGSCVQCSGGCKTCNSSSICLSCSPGFYLDMSSNTCKTCESFIDSCMQCSNVSCLKCRLGFYLQNSTSCLKCLVAMPNCAVCSSQVNCLFCSAGYYKTVNSGVNSCQICPLGCATCLTGTNCTSCNIGFYLISASATCNPCINNCLGCSGPTTCLECQIGYRLGPLGSCISCLTTINFCHSCIYNFTASSFWCLSCQMGSYLDSSDGSCDPCPQNCTNCINSTQCSSCQLGMYLDSNICTACHSNCSECFGSSTNCSSCATGYYLTGNSCLHCSNFGCATCNSTNHNCLSCEIGFYLKTVTGPPTIVCQNCLKAMNNCFVCISQSSCKQCSYGYALASNLSACTPCSVVQGCKHCITIYSCENCQIGYYLSVNSSGFGVCIKCSLGCRDCDSNGVCLSCSSKYSISNVSGVVSCVLCQSSISGCLVCTTNSVCTLCSYGYYLSNNICALCSSSIFGCKYCNSSSICTHCQDSYYLNSSNYCEKCESPMYGCQICNSSSVCLSCQYGMYLNSANTCSLCSNNLPNCLYCKNMTSCLMCDAGSFLSGPNCLNCQAHIKGCIQCNSISDCLQCKGGYFLNITNHLCQSCNQQGCEICQQSYPSLCIRCNTRFYYNSSLLTCIKCKSEIPGCLQCINSYTCSKCQAGSYLNSSFQCVSCQSALTACSRCSSNASCLQCKSTYFLNPNNICQDCKIQIPGCSHCLNNTVCQSCYYGYFMNSSSLCQSCTQISGCLTCESQTLCLFCQTSYFLDPIEKKCYPCDVLQGCYACTNNITCSICAGGYILNKDEMKCQPMRVEAHQKITDLKFVSKYFNQSCLIHFLYAKDMKYNKLDNIDWNKTTKLVLQDSNYQQTNLILLQVKWGENDYTLIFYTNNPLQLKQNDFQLTRLLLQGSISSKYKVNLQMKQQTANKILPQFFLPRDLTMGYDVTSPQFVLSFNNSKQVLILYSIFGYVVFALFLAKYLLKAIKSVPQSNEMGDILAQVASLKSPAFILYPSHLQFVYYCSGYMLPDFPWANQFFGNLLADTSNQIPNPYSLFFYNMHIGSTYLLALIIIFFFAFIFWMVYKSKQEEYKSRFPVGTVLFNFFIFGAVWSGCASLQGGILNPIQTLTLNSALYIIGIIWYCTILGYCIYSVYDDRKKMYMLRIFVKSTLLACAHFSPIYIFSSCILLDILLIIIQHNIWNTKFLYPKLWIAKNILLNMALSILAFLPTLMISLIIASILVFVALILDVYTHIKEYQNQKRRKKLEPGVKNQSNADLNIWNINFDKDSNLQKFDEISFEDSKQVDQKEEETLSKNSGFEKTGLTFNNTNLSSNKRRKRDRKKFKMDESPDIVSFEQNQRGGEYTHQTQDVKNTFVAREFLG